MQCSCQAGILSLYKKRKYFCILSVVLTHISFPQPSIIHRLQGFIKSLGRGVYQCSVTALTMRCNGVGLVYLTMSIRYEYTGQIWPFMTFKGPNMSGQCNIVSNDELLYSDNFCNENVTFSLKGEKST